MLFHTLIWFLTFLFRVLYCCLTANEIMLLHTKVDLVVTLGGDGTVLWVCDDNVFELKRSNSYHVTVASLY